MIVGDAKRFPTDFANENFTLKPRDYSPFTKNYLEIKKEFGLSKAVESLKKNFTINISNYFFGQLLRQNEIQNWVDIENEYYETLLYELSQEKKKKGSSDISKLNYELDLTKNLLVAHLRNEQLKTINKIDLLANKVININKWNPSIKSGRRYEPILKTLVVNFNYTNTFERLYLDDLKNFRGMYSPSSVEHIHIQGDINDLENNPIIFGYGDELDKNSKDLVEVSGSEFFKNIKSLNYQYTSHYKSILRFIDENQFEVVIMGHSCGNSDRTLLNTVFEHDNCSSIKPYYHAWEGGNNYFDIVCNIYRNFTKNSSFRERVVEKNLCETLT